MRHGFDFRSGVNTLDFVDWGIVSQVLAFCTVVSTEVLRRREDFLQVHFLYWSGRLWRPAEFAFSCSTT